MDVISPLYNMYLVIVFSWSYMAVISPLYNMYLVIVFYMV